VLIFLCPENLHADTTIKQIRDGVQFIKTNHRPKGSSNGITIYIVRVDTEKVDIKVLNNYKVIKSAEKRFPSYSLREISKLLDPVAIINGAFSDSFTIPIPSGLVVQDGEETSPLNMASSLQSGIFCIDEEGVKILDKNGYENGMCNQAIQSGPRIVEYPGVNGIRESEKSKKNKFTRSVVAIDKFKRVLLVKTSEAFLYDIAEFLLSPESVGGFSCIAALNLSGDVQSGLSVSVSNKKRIEVGAQGATIPSSIAVFAKGD
jgi:uncharacterized protein YigE (DUF2233 family)